MESKTVIELVYKSNSGKIKLINELSKKLCISQEKINITIGNESFCEGDENEFKKIKKYNILIEINDDLNDYGYMFEEAPIISINKFYNPNISNVDDFGGLFSNCKYLEDVSGIANWDTSSVNYMDSMFKNCKSLKFLPDISHWNTGNVTTMKGMFQNCKELISVPDISGWNTFRVNNMENLFNGCESLKSLPDISKWDLSNLKKMKGMFNKCYYLENIPNISQWDLKNVNDDDIDNLYSDCFSLTNIPNHKWNIEITKRSKNLFKNCFNLALLPDIMKSYSNDIIKHNIKGCFNLLYN